MTTAELGILSTAFVGALGIVVPAVSRWFDRGHERSLAQANRLHAQRLALYNDVASYLEVLRLIAARTHPVVGESQLGPAAPTEEEAISFTSRLSVGGSEPVVTWVRIVGEMIGQFRDAVERYESIPRNHPQSAEARRNLDETRDALVMHVDEAERLMRNELSNL